MYMIAVCDDEKTAVRYIASTVEEHFQKNNYPVSIDPYFNSEELKKRLLGGTKYDVLLLDIDMPSLNGIDLCREYRRCGGDALVVFISNKEALVFQSFDVQPFRFVRKSFFAEEIDHLCADLMEELSRRSEKWIRFEDSRKDVIYSVNVRKLIYVEAFGRECRLVSVDDTRDVRIKFTDVQRQLASSGFLQIHRSYLVNPYYIYQIGQDTVITDRKHTLPISRYRREAVKEAYLRWHRGEI